MRQLVRQLAVVFFSAILSLARGLVASPTTPRCSSMGLDCCPRADEEPRLRSCPARRLVVMMSSAASDPDATRDPDESAEQVSLDRPDVDEDSIEANRISAEGVMRVRERARLRTGRVPARWSKSTERQGPEQRHVPRPPTPEQVRRQTRCLRPCYGVSTPTCLAPSSEVWGDGRRMATMDSARAWTRSWMRMMSRGTATVCAPERARFELAPFLHTCVYHSTRVPYGCEISRCVEHM